MVLKFFPQPVMSMGCRKQFKSNYAPSGKNPSVSEIAAWMKGENAAAKRVFTVWLGINTLVAGFYWAGFYGEPEMLLLSLLYYVFDLICIVIYCPFQALIMKNRCCVTCRIFNWDSIMMFTPLIFVRSLFSWSLVAIALILLIHWEVTYRKHPERFMEESNANLNCAHCNDRLCKVKIE
jgi:hypothetical protein